MPKPDSPERAPTRLGLPRSSRYGSQNLTSYYPELGPSFTSSIDERLGNAPSQAGPSGSFGRWRPSQIQRDTLLSSKDTIHIVTVREQFRLDLIANKYYDDSRLWWVVAFLNDIRNPFTEPITNDRLVIVPFERLIGSLVFFS